MAPITDAHIHVWSTQRDIPWPGPEYEKLYRDVAPADYKAVAERVGITGAGIVEASDRFEDQLWVLEQVKGDDFFKFYVAMLEVGADDFVDKLDSLGRNELVVGIRGFLWAPELTVDERQVAHCKVLAERGMTLDVVSRGTLNPKEKVISLARAVPILRMVVDHLGGAKGRKPDPKWGCGVRALAEHENVFMKFSSFFDMYNPEAGEQEEWTSPADLASYGPHFDVLFEAFGAERIIWGSNWPVVEMGGTIERQISLAEEYLAPMGKDVRDKVMSGNALRFYMRTP